MRIFKIAFLGLMLPFGLGMSHVVLAQTASNSFAVTVFLRTFSEAVTADHRCISRWQGEVSTATMRISCPMTVDVQAIQAISGASSSRARLLQQMNSSTEKAAGTQFMVSADQPIRSNDPVDLTISW